jgi:hypothetical protein
MALPEKLISALKTGFKIGELFEKWYIRYTADPNMAVFKFEGETVEDLINYCKLDKWAPISSILNVYNQKLFDIVCAWIIVNHYDSFLELVEIEDKSHVSEHKFITDLLERKFYFICDLISRWDYCQSVDWRDKNSYYVSYWHPQTYTLMQKLFDDLFDKNFNHQTMWNVCLDQAFAKEDLSRIEYLTDALYTIETELNKDEIMNTANQNHLLAYPKVYLKMYPTDVSQLNFRSSTNIDYVSYMISNGYLMTNDDFIYLLKFSRSSSQKNMTKLFLDNIFQANLTQDFIDTCFSISISNENMDVFRYLIENHNPNTHGEIIRSYYYGEYRVLNPCYLASTILSKKYEMATMLMSKTDLSVLDDKFIVQIIRAMVIMFDKDMASKLVSSLIPSHEITSLFLDALFEIASKSDYPFVVHVDMVLFVYKLGCVLDEEYLHKILRFLDPEALDLILQNLNLTLEDIPLDLISKIIKSHSIAFEKMITKLEFSILEYKQQQYVSNRFKTQIKVICAKYTKTLDVLVMMSKVSKNGSSMRLDDKVNCRLYLFLIEKTGTETHLVETAKKVINQFYYVVDQCYDLNTFNAFDGKIPEPIIWKEKN